MKITKDTLIFDILRLHPESLEVFNSYNMGCASCLGIQSESVEKASLMHGLDMDKLIEDLNKAVSKA